MPQVQVTTKQSEKLWTSPDGQRTIHSVALMHNGQLVNAKTYSNAIAVEGFSGEVETYEKIGKNGPETFVKQVQKEGSYQGGGGSRQPKDEAAIKAMWAIGQAVSIDSADLTAVESTAKQLFAMVDRVKVGEPAIEAISTVDIDAPLDIPDIFAS